MIAAVEAGWGPLRAAVAALPPDVLARDTGSGWTAKELLAHVAFWDEAVEGAVVALFRQQPLPDGWAFGSGYVPEAGGGWPSFEVHNAREAAWGRERTAEEVLARLDTAHAALLRFLKSVTDEEAAEHAEYFASLPQHYAEHHAELRAGA